MTTETDSLDDLLSRTPPLADFLKTARGTVTSVNDRFIVSTVKLPSLAYGECWETMVFAVKDGRVHFRERDCDRYGTAEESKTGHAAMVLKWCRLEQTGQADEYRYWDDSPEV